MAKRDTVKSHKYSFRTDSAKLLKINKRNKAIISTTGLFTDIHNKLKLKCSQHQTATKTKKRKKHIKQYGYMLVATVYIFYTGYHRLIFKSTSEEMFV